MYVPPEVSILQERIFGWEAKLRAEKLIPNRKIYADRLHELYADEMRELVAALTELVKRYEQDMRTQTTAVMGWETLSTVLNKQKIKNGLGNATLAINRMKKILGLQEGTIREFERRGSLRQMNDAAIEWLEIFKQSYNGQLLTAVHHAKTAKKEFSAWENSTKTVFLTPAEISIYGGSVEVADRDAEALQKRELRATGRK